MGAAIGIDLGTTNTVVAAVVDGVAITLPDERGRRLLPSIVSFHPNGETLVGAAAKERRLIDPANTIYSTKRLIGRSFHSPEVENARAKFPFSMVLGPKDTTMVVARNVQYALPEISAFILRKAKAIAEEALGVPVDRAVVTVPASFNDLQRASTKMAGKLAGLEVLRILNEPTAAALAYGQGITQSERVAVYDLGGGTFDSTLLDLTGSVFEVLSTAGDSALGGEDIDTLVADEIAHKIIRTHRYDPRTNSYAYGTLRIIGEYVKEQLSTLDEITFEVRDIGYGVGGELLSVVFQMTRPELEALARPLVERTISVTTRVIAAAGLDVRAFDRVLLVGGATRMPLVARSVKDFFGMDPHLKVNPDEVVALGAAIQAFQLSKSRIKPKKTGARTLAQVEATTRMRQSSPPPPTLPGGELPFVRDTRVEPAGDEQPKPALPPRPAPRESRPPPGSVPPPPPAIGRAALPPRAPSAPPPAPTERQPQRFHDAPPLSPPADLLPLDDFPLEELTDVDPEPQARKTVPPPLPPEARRRSVAPTLPDRDDLPALPEPAPRPPAAEPSVVQPAPALAAPALAAPAPAEEPPIEPERGIRARSVPPLLIDVTPLSLRVETAGGYSDTLIRANSPVPCAKTRSFRTCRDGQTVVVIRVAQGEETRFTRNTYLGELELAGIPAATRGEVEIAVTFALDADGILNVRAEVPQTGKKTSAVLRLLGVVTDARDIEKMMAAQKRHAVV